MASSGKFTWRITDFSGRKKSERTIFSDVFTVGGCKWRIKLDHLKGLHHDVYWLLVNLEVADVVGLPSEWCIDAKYSLTVLNQLRSSDSTTSKGRSEFTALRSGTCGQQSLRILSKLYDSSKGYLVDNTLVVETEIEVLNVSSTTVVLLETFISNLDNFITDHAGQGQNFAGSSSNGGLKSEVPSLKDVEIAEQSLKECVSDLFKLNIKDKLATSLETLSRAEQGWYTSEEQRAIEVFWGEFDDFVADFLTFEHENSEFELHKLARDRKLRSIKNYHETYCSIKLQLDDLTKEEEEYKKKMEEARSKKVKLISSLQIPVMEVDKAKSEYTSLEKKLKEAEERKMKAEERMSRFNSAWLSLKQHFSN